MTLNSLSMARGGDRGSGGEVPCSRSLRQRVAESGLKPGSSDLCLELLQLHLGPCSLGAYDSTGNKTDKIPKDH